MAVSSTSTTVSYTGNGSTTSFAVTFPFQGTGATAELEVVQRTIATGAETTLSYTTHYTVTGGNGSTGAVVAASAPANTVQLHIIRKTLRTQTVDYTANDPFPADTHELALDRLAMGVQELEKEINRSVVAPVTDPADIAMTLPPKATRATKALGFDSAGDPVVSTLTLAAMEAGSTSAATSATAAASSATAAANSATASANSATTSGNSATASANSATASAASAASIGLTTRGDLLKRGASANERLAIGSANTVLTTNGTDPAWSTISNAMLAGSIDLTSKVTGALPIANGGTASTSTGAARSALGLAIGSNVQAFSSNIVQKNVQNTFSKAQVPSTSTASLASTSGVLDYDTFTNFIITLASGSNTLAAPTTEASQIGQCGVIIFVQPSSSSAATLSLHGDYETVAAAGITLSTANNDYDVVPYMIKADNSVLLGAAQLNFG